MLKKCLLFFLISSGFFVQSQELFFTLGKNYTTYDYKNSLGNSSSSLRSGDGAFYQLGVDFKLNKAAQSSPFSYALSLIYNQFNAVGVTQSDNYTWTTNYIGIQNVLNYALFHNTEVFNIKTKIGFAASTILKGEQQINNNVYDITKHDEFSGLVIQPSIGVDLHYAINKNINISGGYEFSKAFNVSNASSEQLSFINNQIHLGLHFPLQ